MGKCILCLKREGRGRGPFFRVPHDERRNKLWCKACGVVQFRSRDIICADHFSSSDIVLGAKRAILIPSAVPCQPSYSGCHPVVPDPISVACRDSNQLPAVSSMNVNCGLDNRIPVGPYLCQAPTSNMAVPPPVQAERPHSPVDCVEMHTLGVFVPRRHGYVAAVDKISRAEDPLDMGKHRPMDWVDPIEPDLSMDVQIIKRENYVDGSSDDEQTVVKLSDSDEDSLVHEENVKSENDKNWSISAGRKRGEIANVEKTQWDDYISDNTIRTEDSLDAIYGEAETIEVVRDDIFEYLVTIYPTERLPNYQRNNVAGTVAMNVSAKNPVPVTYAVGTKPHQPIKANGLGTAKQLLSKPKLYANTAKNDVIDNHSSIILSDSSTLQVSPLGCVLKCNNYKKLYAFPSAETEPQRRHFWFLELRLKPTTNWHKSLYICDNHFEESMLIKNTLHKYAYPCKGLKHQIKVNIRNLGTQTNSNAFERYNYKDLLSELTNLEKLDSQQTKEISRIKVLIRLKQEAMRLVAEIEDSKGAPDASETN